MLSVRYGTVRCGAVRCGTDSSLYYILNLDRVYIIVFDIYIYIYIYIIYIDICIARMGLDGLD